MPPGLEVRSSTARRHDAIAERVGHAAPVLRSGSLPFADEPLRTISLRGALTPALPMRFEASDAVTDRRCDEFRQSGGHTFRPHFSLVSHLMTDMLGWAARFYIPPHHSGHGRQACMQACGLRRRSESRCAHLRRMWPSTARPSRKRLRGEAVRADDSVADRHVHGVCS